MSEWGRSGSDWERVSEWASKQVSEWLSLWVSKNESRSEWIAKEWVRVMEWVREGQEESKWERVGEGVSVNEGQCTSERGSRSELMRKCQGVSEYFKCCNMFQSGLNEVMLVKCSMDIKGLLTVRWDIGFILKILGCHMVDIDFEDQMSSRALMYILSNNQYLVIS